MDRQKAANGNLIFINNCCGCYKRVLLARQILLKNQGHRIIKYWIKWSKPISRGPTPYFFFSYMDSNFEFKFLDNVCQSQKAGIRKHTSEEVFKCRRFESSERIFCRKA